MTVVSVVTWNLHQAVDKRTENKAATWRYLAEEIRPTVALVQEADGIPASVDARASHADDVRYGTAVVAYGAKLESLPPVRTRYSKHEFEIKPSVDAGFAAARVVDLPGGVDPIVAVSMYGRIMKGYAQTGILRAIADLTPLFDSKLGRRVVLGGDLNAYDQPPADRTSRRRWAALFAHFKTLGLVNLLELTQADRGPLPGCRCEYPACYHVETWRPPGRLDRPSTWCLDYLFATKELADRLVRPLEVRHTTRPEVWNLSDHSPLVARFDL